MDAMAVLHEIVAADRKAREAADQARRQSVEFDGNLERLRQELAVQALDRAKADVEQARKQAVAQAQSEIDALEAQHRRQMKELSVRFEVNRDKTVEKMFRMTVGLE